ncbi:DUF6252 family protein [Flavobacterium alkalisoli]|uniref:DUF6252 family protein n=1 Tax=Flavobacterium alkalisoli TaxID=2602769 RepID=UPI003A92F014
MKKISLLFTLFFIGLTVVSCSNDDDFQLTAPYVTYDFNGEKTYIAGENDEKKATMYNDMIEIVAHSQFANQPSSVGVSFSFRIQGEGTYNDVEFYIEKGGEGYWSKDENEQTNGTVNVTEIDTQDHTISGTFSFLAYHMYDTTTAEVTAGVFEKIPYSGTLPVTQD